MFFYLHDLFPFDCLVNGDLVLLQFLIQVLPRFPLTIDALSGFQE